ncbi:MAG: cobalamin-independent methionine synthase II family protein [Verrucomicrobiales bacterium]|nr:cobalamin-independent methionine synthase II family protein [Verrucomicrobiales bacterium]
MISPREPAFLRTTTVGSYPVPDWLVALPSEQALDDAMRVVLSLQRDAGIDLPTDGELYRFDINHPDTNGMIDFFIRPLAGVQSAVGWTDWNAFCSAPHMGFRRKPAGVVTGPVGEGSLNLVAHAERWVRLAGPAVKFTVTSPYMLARTLLDRHYGNKEALLLALADVLANQVRQLPCDCLQVDEANITGCPEDAPLAAAAINRVLDAFPREKAVHLCFGNYGGQTIQKGTWKALLGFLNALRTDHLVLELAHRPEADRQALAEIDARIGLGIGVIDVKVNTVETPEVVAARIDDAAKRYGAGRLRYVHPDCGFWMLKRSVADRKIEALVKGRNLYLGR